MPHIDIALAIVQNGPNLLIAQRLPHAKQPSHYEFPGGKLHPPESPADCALRELHEETSVIAQVLQPLTVIEHTYSYATLHIHPFLCRYLAGTPQPLACQRVLWIVPQTLHHYRFPTANQSLLAELRQLLDSPTNQP